MIKRFILPAIFLAIAPFLPAEERSHSHLEDLSSIPITTNFYQKESWNPQIEVSVNYETIPSSQKEIDYTRLNTLFANHTEKLVVNSSDGVKISAEEKEIIGNILDGIKEGKINSYEEFVNRSQELSEKQKLILLSAEANLYRKFNYEKNVREKIVSQDTFFDAMYKDIILGGCRAQSTHMELLAGDIGLEADAVSGGGHQYTIIKTEKGLAIVDAYKWEMENSGIQGTTGFILTSNTKNVGKILKAYHKEVGKIAFAHSFIDNTETKYRLITPDGKNFLRFIGYDETSRTLENSLTKESQSGKNFKITFNMEEFLTSGKFDVHGFFLKVGEISGDSSSPLNKISALQVGYNNELTIPSVLKVIPNIRFTLGDIQEDTEISNNYFYGPSGDLIVSTDNEKGFNFTSRVAGNVFYRRAPLKALFFDLLIGGGASYRIPLEKGEIEPYTLVQYTFFPKDIGIWNYRPGLREIRTGVEFERELGDEFHISIEPGYVWRPWEHEFRGEIEFGNNKDTRFNLGVETYFTKSTYKFCPDTFGFKGGLNFMIDNFFDVAFRGNLRTTDYDGEKETQGSLSILSSIKL